MCRLGYICIKSFHCLFRACISYEYGLDVILFVQ